MSGKGTLKNFKQMLAEAKLPERTVDICMRGDLAAEYEQVDRQLVEAAKRTNNSLDGGGDIGALAERLTAIEDEMREHSYTFVLRGLPKPKFRQLLADHPPRRINDDEIHERDRQIGLNADTFFDALIRACLVDPELDDADWTALEEKLTDRQYDELSDAAWSVNRGDVDIPFSRAASLINRTSVSE